MQTLLHGLKEMNQEVMDAEGRRALQREKFHACQAQFFQAWEDKSSDKEGLKQITGKEGGESMRRRERKKANGEKRRRMPTEKREGE